MSDNQTVEKAIAEFRKGKFVVVVDDEHRENEGDLVIAAEDISPPKVNFLLKNGRGMICVPMTKQRLAQLKLPQMVFKNEEHTKSMFTITVDAKRGITTGISAADRAKTIQLLANQKSKASDFVRPGHVFPLQAAKNGLKERQGHTEAALELCKLAGKHPAAVICEILNEDGTMARMPQLKKFAKKRKLALITIHQLHV
jgi:3,4-dihydroxy 2-butanone 4-phosphate synthase/GTP cyclohydrolase II